MAVTYGFYNSINKDRMYNAIQMSQIFDGVINDGVYMSVLSHFAVRAGSGMSVVVGGGRAWFNHTWTYNDSDMIVTIDDSEFEATRIDAIVIKIDRRETARANSIEVIKGTPSDHPVKPELQDSEDVYYHPLAYVTVNAGVTEITNADIENCVGVNERTPFVTGIIETINAEELIGQWQAEWDEWNAEHRQAYLDWVAQQESDMENWQRQHKAEYDAWAAQQMSDMDQFLDNEKTEIRDWFQHLRDELDENQAAHLQNQIDVLQEDMEDYKQQTTEDLEEFKEETSAELTEQTFKLAHDLCNRVTNIEYENGSISRITSTNSDYSAVSVTTFEETSVGKNVITAVTKDGWIYTETVVINNNTHTITESYTKEEVTP